MRELTSIDGNILYESILYLLPIECLSVRVCCKYINEICMRKSLWEQMCLRVVGGLANYTKQELRLLLIDLKVSSYFDLFWATRNLQFDLLGVSGGYSGTSFFSVLRK